MKRLEKIKAIFDTLESELKALEKMQPKDSDQRNIENETRRYIRKARKYLKGVKVDSFRLVADGKGTPPPQERTLEPEIDDSESVVAASNAETPKAKAKAKRARSKSKKSKK